MKKSKIESTDVLLEDGPICSSNEVSVMGTERRNRVVPVDFLVNFAKEDEPVNEAKPFDIPKRLIWESYKRVKSNKGAAGVDGQSIREFDQNRDHNLYKIWNRMSSGTYFAPPVRAVAIPKKTGGERILGVPTESVTELHRQPSRCCLSRGWRKCSTPIPMVIVAVSLHMMR